MKKLFTTVALLALVMTGVSGMAFAQDIGVPDHPRINEVDQRLQNQEKRIDAGVAAGEINPKQEARDQATDAKVSQELSKDEAKNGGTITKAEQRKMNRQLNKNSKRIHRQRKAGQAKKATTTTP